MKISIEKLIERHNELKAAASFHAEQSVKALGAAEEIATIIESFKQDQAKPVEAPKK